MILKNQKSLSQYKLTIRETRKKFNTMKTVRTHLSTAKDLGRVFYEKETNKNRPNLKNSKSTIRAKLILSQLARLRIFQIQILMPSTSSRTSQSPQDYSKSLTIVKEKARLQPQMSSETPCRSWFRFRPAEGIHKRILWNQNCLSRAFCSGLKAKSQQLAKRPKMEW